MTSAGMLIVSRPRVELAYVFICMSLCSKPAFSLKQSQVLKHEKAKPVKTYGSWIGGLFAVLDVLA